MEFKKLKLAFIGGSISSAVGYSHFAATKMDNRFELVAGCFSRHSDIAAETAQIYGVSAERSYTDWREMIHAEKSNLDAISILTPTPCHYEMVSECIRAGIPVICEKALATNSEEAFDLQNLVREHNGFLAVTYNYTGYPMVRELRKIVQDGKIGDILHFQAQMPQEGFIRLNKVGKKPIPQQWRLEDKTIPTLYLDLCTHLHEIVHYLTEKSPTSVVCDQASDGWFENIIDNVSCLSRYDKNIQGQFWFSKSALGHRNGLEISIYGTKGAAKWVQMNPEELELSFVDGTKVTLDRASTVDIADAPRYTRFKAGHPAGFIEAFANVYFDIHKALVEYQTSGKWASNEVFGAELAHEGLVFFEAMVKSSKTSKWEEISAIKQEVIL